MAGRRGDCGRQKAQGLLSLGEVSEVAGEIALPGGFLPYFRFSSGFAAAGAALLAAISVSKARAVASFSASLLVT